jgi:hypothetical protein
MTVQNDPMWTKSIRVCQKKHQLKSEICNMNVPNDPVWIKSIREC